MNLRFIIIFLLSLFVIIFIFFFSQEIIKKFIPDHRFNINSTLNLVNHKNEKITKFNFVGNPSILFFGFTNCPDVCPTTLNDLSLLLDKLGEKGKNLKVYFVTLDPERDTVDVLNDYIPYFGQQFIGVTGEEDNILNLVKNWGIYRKKNLTNKQDYLIDHTASVFLINSEGQFAGTIAYQEKSDVALEKLENLIRK